MRMTLYNEYEIFCKCEKYDFLQSALSIGPLLLICTRRFPHYVCTAEFNFCK